ncbi:helix-turn-helix transcriptional regulator [Hydrocarboniphaga sp.]|uniref:helix-turn-helix transcriptional regulator n=1 Tax=Hydrocarboniphaga sp. TaxID=2033016 RepID=UPI003D0A2BDD
MQRQLSGQQGRTTQVDADMALRIGRVQLVRNSWDAPIDTCKAGTQHHLELSMLPRVGEQRGCFPELWGADRFEPIGEVFLLPAAQLFHARSQCRQQHSLICRLDPPAVAEWFEGELPWTERRLRGSLDIGSTRIRHLLAGMAAELREPGFASSAMIELMAAQTAIELSRHLFGIEQRARPAGGLAAWRLRLIDERVSGDPLAPSLSELAQLCGVSVRHLTRSFRASRGYSIGQYLEEQRIAHAKRMLAAGRSVKAVAYTLGFTAPTNFAAAFRRAAGESPRQYQQQAGRARLQATAPR